MTKFDVSFEKFFWLSKTSVADELLDKKSKI